MSNVIESKLNERLKAAMKSKSQQELAVIRAIRSKVGEARTAKGFSGEVDDALYEQAIASYVKSMTKARDEYLKAGERGAELAAQLDYEIGYLSEFLPKKLGEAETEALVRDVIARTGATSRKEMGKVMGAVMKDHKDEVDPSLVRQAAERLLE